MASKAFILPINSKFFRLFMVDHQQTADEILCPCSGTTKGQIKSLFEQGKDIDAISRWTGAISGCGGCEWDITEYLELLAQSKPQP